MQAGWRWVWLNHTVSQNQETLHKDNEKHHHKLQFSSLRCICGRGFALNVTRGACRAHPKYSLAGLVRPRGAAKSDLPLEKFGYGHAMVWLLTLWLDHWMVVCKCHRRRDCRMWSTAVCGAGRTWITTMSCKPLTTVNMHSAWRRTMSASIRTTISEWKHLVSIALTCVVEHHFSYA